MKFEYEGIIKKKKKLLVSSCLLGGMPASGTVHVPSHFEVCWVWDCPNWDPYLEGQRITPDLLTPTIGISGPLMGKKITLKIYMVETHSRDLWWRTRWQRSLVETCVGIVLCLSDLRSNDMARLLLIKSPLTVSSPCENQYLVSSTISFGNNHLIWCCILWIYLITKS